MPLDVYTGAFLVVWLTVYLAYRCGADVLSCFVLMDMCFPPLHVLLLVAAVAVVLVVCMRIHPFIHPFTLQKGGWWW